jgi:hypothetical protein
MQIIYEAKEAGKVLSELIFKYKNYYILTAWASGEHTTFNNLIKNKNNIQKMVVGTQFYQTNPNFIKEFIGSTSVKFIIEPKKGIFHPKIYLFENNENDWQCLIGSANFTKSAFSINDEILIQINQEDKNAKEIYFQLKEQIDKYWNNAKAIDDIYFKRYKVLFKKSISILDKLENKFTQNKSKKSILQSKVLTMDWDEYYKNIKNDKFHSFEKRLALLETAKQYFKQYDSFQCMPDEIRKQIAGIKKYDPNKSKEKFDWAWFGSMAGAGYFKQKIKEKNINISNALDSIPLDGAVSYKDYQNFIYNFKKAFIPTGGDGLATATRLLTIKRPDYFLCLDSQNKEKLCNDFGIKKSLNYEEYWTEIIQRIQDSLWWENEKPTNKDDANELKSWNGRVAMLDVVFYKEKIV